MEVQITKVSPLSPLKIALVGNTGVGKTTFVSFVRDNLKGKIIKEVRLAKPLYRVQSYIYKICNTKKNASVQDGVLLNFLGQHMRSINSRIIEEHFIAELNRISPQVEVIICSDARPIDTSFIKQQNFLIIQITSETHFSSERRIKRGDLFLANSQHWTEQQHHSFDPDYKIENNGTIKVYKATALELIRRIYDSHWKRN